MARTATPEAPFGRVLTAMVTPFTPDGELDLAATGELASDLVALGNDGLVVNGTTGESATTTDEEKDLVVRAVLEAVGDRAHVVAGIGTSDTRHTIELGAAAVKAGAHGVLVVTPYYNKPPQAGLLAHFTAVCDAVELPAVLYDIPARAGVPIATDTLLRLAEHPRVVGVKDAKGDLFATQRVLAATDLAYYSGDDLLNLPLLAVGAVGVVSVTGHLVADRLRAMVGAYDSGGVGDARRINEALLPVTTAIMTRTQGAITVKAALEAQHRPGGGFLRPPLVGLDHEGRELMRVDLAAGGVPGFAA